MLQKNRLNIQRYCTSSLFYLCSVYSLLNASIGFKFAAFTEGSSPNTTPITVENNTAITIDGTLIAVGEESSAGAQPILQKSFKGCLR